MRVAMLLPLEVGVSCKLYGRIVKVVSLLTEELLKSDINVVSFSPTTPKMEANPENKRAFCGENRLLSLKALECLHISDAFEQAEHFDVIHNHDDFLPLSYTNLVKPPIVTTIYEPFCAESFLLYKKYNGRAFYVSDKDLERSSELDYSAVINHNIDDVSFDLNEMANAYIKVYKYAVDRKHREDQRPWGRYIVLSDTPEQRSKLVHVYPGKRLSLQRHKRRHEHWHIVKGEALITLNDAQLQLKMGESIEIPKGAIHRITNNGAEVMTFFEVQTGDYLGEDDIERLEDDYARHLSE